MPDITKQYSSERCEDHVAFFNQTLNVCFDMVEGGHAQILFAC